MVRHFGLAVLALVAVSATAYADPSSPDATATAASAQAPASDPDEIVCRANQVMTGTRIPSGRICHTRREWDKMQEESKMMVQQQQATGLMNSPTGH
jgi:hypothetical protein